eukprot:2325671-Rhodomonas_salina.2
MVGLARKGGRGGAHAAAEAMYRLCLLAADGDATVGKRATREVTALWFLQGRDSGGGREGGGGEGRGEGGKVSGEVLEMATVALRT